jgi:hypothetical protein
VSGKFALSQWVKSPVTRQHPLPDEEIVGGEVS